MDAQSILIVGGCRSGKSRIALEMARQSASTQKIFIATCQAQDDEMRGRIEQHKKERENDWRTLEIPLLLPEAIRSHRRPQNILLVDCLTLWVSNLLLHPSSDQRLESAFRNLCQAIEETEGTVIFVSNEVGTGIVPENRLARRFRDEAGFLNQKIAGVVDRVVWSVAGIPVTIKPAGQPGISGTTRLA